MNDSSEHLGCHAVLTSEVENFFILFTIIFRASFSKRCMISRHFWNYMYSGTDFLIFSLCKSCARHFSFYS